MVDINLKYNAFVRKANHIIHQLREQLHQLKKLQELQKKSQNQKRNQNEKCLNKKHYTKSAQQFSIYEQSKTKVKKIQFKKQQFIPKQSQFYQIRREYSKVPLSSTPNIKIKREYLKKFDLNSSKKTFQSMKKFPYCFQESLQKIKMQQHFSTISTSPFKIQEFNNLNNINRFQIPKFKQGKLLEKQYFQKYILPQKYRNKQSCTQNKNMVLTDKSLKQEQFLNSSLLSLKSYDSKYLLNRSTSVSQQKRFEQHQELSHNNTQNFSKMQNISFSFSNVYSLFEQKAKQQQSNFNNRPFSFNILQQQNMQISEKNQKTIINTKKPSFLITNSERKFFINKKNKIEDQNILVFKVKNKRKIRQQQTKISQNFTFTQKQM